MFHKKLHTLDKNCLYGLVAPFGSGKSSFLKMVEEKDNSQKKEENKQGNIWIHFDAWQFPNRKELWEGFLIDFARQLKGISAQEMIDQIEGEPTRWVSKLIHLAAVI